MKISNISYKVISQQVRDVFLDVTGITQSVILTGQLADAVALGENYNFEVFSLDFIIENKDVFLFLKQNLSEFKETKSGFYSEYLGKSEIFIFNIKGIQVRFHLYRNDNLYYNRDTEIVKLFGNHVKVISTKSRFLFHKENVSLVEDVDLKNYHQVSLDNFYQCFFKKDVKLSVAHRIALSQVFELIDLNNLIIVGSLADYINLRGNVDLKVGDMDFVILGQDSLLHFSKYYKLIPAEEPVYGDIVPHKQYYTFINGVKLDFFVVEFQEDFDSINFDINSLMGVTVKSNSIKEALKVHEGALKKFKNLTNKYLMTKHSRRLGLYNLLEDERS